MSKPTAVSFHHTRLMRGKSGAPWTGVFVEIIQHKPSRGKPFYAYCDQGYLFSATLKNIHEYVVAQRQRFKWIREEIAVKESGSGTTPQSWQTRWMAFHELASKSQLLVPGYKTNWRIRLLLPSTHRYPFSYPGWCKQHGKPLRGVPLLKSGRYSFNIESVLPYIAIAEEDKVSLAASPEAAYIPFCRGVKQWGSVLTVEEPSYHTISKDERDCPVRAMNYAAFPLVVAKVVAVERAWRTLRSFLDKFLRTETVLREVCRVFRESVDPQDVAKSAIKTADETLAFQGEAVEIIRRGSAAKALKKVALDAFRYLLVGEGGGRFGRRYTALWVQHCGNYGPVFVMGYLLRLLRESGIDATLEKWLAEVLDPEKNPLLKGLSKVEPDGDAPGFLMFDAAMAPDAKIIFSLKANWMHKSFMIMTDMSAWYIHRKMYAVVSGSVKAYDKALSGAMKMMVGRHFDSGSWASDIGKIITRLNSIDETLDQTIGAFEKTITHFRNAPKARNIKPWQVLNPNYKVDADSIDDLFAGFGKIGEALCDADVADPLKKVLNDLVVDVTAEMNSTAARNARQWGVVAEGGSLCVTALSGVLCLALAWDVYNKSKWPAKPGELERAIADVVGQSLGVMADIISAKSAMKSVWCRLRGKVNLSQDVAGASRTVGASRVFGVVSSFIYIGISIYDMEMAASKGNVRSTVANIGVLIGSTIVTYGFFVDGSGALPVGIALNIIGTAIVVISSMWDTGMFSGSEPVGMAYLQSLKKQLNDFGDVANGPLSDALSALVDNKASYAQIPVNAFVVRPNARAFWEMEDGEEYDWLGAIIPYRVEKFRLGDQPLTLQERGEHRERAVAFTDSPVAHNTSAFVATTLRSVREEEGSRHEVYGSIDTLAVLAADPRMSRASLGVVFEVADETGKRTRVGRYLASPLLKRPREYIHLKRIWWMGGGGEYSVETLSDAHYRVGPGGVKWETASNPCVAITIEGKLKRLLDRGVEVSGSVKLAESDWGDDELAALTFSMAELLYRTDSSLTFAVPLGDAVIGKLANSVSEQEDVLQLYVYWTEVAFRWNGLLVDTLVQGGSRTEAYSNYLNVKLLK